MQLLINTNAEELLTVLCSSLFKHIYKTKEDRNIGTLVQLSPKLLQICFEICQMCIKCGKIVIGDYDKKIGEDDTENGVKQSISSLASIRGESK